MIPICRDSDNALIQAAASTEIFGDAVAFIEADNITNIGFDCVRIFGDVACIVKR